MGRNNSLIMQENWWFNLAVNASVSASMGVTASWIFWLYLTRRLSPRLEFSSKVCISRNNDLIKYRIKIRNSGNRAAVDFSAYCLLRVPGVATGENFKLVALRTLDVPLPRLAPKAARVITVKTDGLNPRAVETIPDPLRSWLNRNPPSGVDQIIRSFPGSELVLHISAYDEVSGSRKFFRSKPYTESDFLWGYFDQSGVDPIAGGNPA